MSGYSNFITESSIKAKEQERSKARAFILEKAQKKYEADERRDRKKKESGEGSWMLNTVNKRIQKEQKTLEDAKSKSKKKKKKEKKKKKKKKHHRRSDSSSSSSSENSEDEAQWVESKPSNNPDSSENKPLQRDSWMEAPIDLLPAISRQEIRDAANKEKAKAKMEAEKHLQPGQHAKELNPYWKNGGSGLPSAPQSSASSAGATGDGGLSWLLKGLSRMKQQAQDENRSLEEIAAERYGSLDRLMSMIREAENSQGRGGDRHRKDWGRREREVEGRRNYKDGDRDKDRYREGNREGGRNRERERWCDEREDRRHGSDRDKQESRGSSGKSLQSKFQRPSSDDEERSDKHHNSSKSHNNASSGDRSGRMFKKPNDDVSSGRKKDDYDKSFQIGRSRLEPEDRGGGYDRKDGWRKSLPQRNDDDTPRWMKRDHSKESDVKTTGKSSEKSHKQSSSESSSSEDENEKSESDNEQQSAVPMVKVMTETELNDLAAKILRAEIMGDETQTSKLKATLEEARRVRDSNKATEGKTGETDFVHSNSKSYHGGRKKEAEGEGDDNVVVLSRTNKAGMVRPVLPSSSIEWGKPAGKKRKRKNVETHSESGERTKYFHDDDNFDLKTLVEREKAGTAEDQNSMFARLAGRETDRDLDMDDMFVSKAAKNHQEEETVNRDKMAAIFEHRKKSSAMEKCTRCFDKVPKHLIVAIGRKCYLSLPDHASLTEGHCFIVPMAHSTSATTLDEDVWQDIQNFRKSLVQMFLSQDKDMVIMETSMRLKHFPHMAIECIPLEQEVGDLSPIYFKKALQDVGPEWAQNKKIHDLSKKDVRHTVPKGFPYFSVDFGLQGGFAHVIEDEATFPTYFGREIVGGMLDAEPNLWRKPRKQNFEDQRQKMLQFEKWWSPFDWTQNLD